MIARLFAREGAALALLDLAGGKLREIEAESAQIGPETSYEVDVTNSPKVQQVMKSITADLGGGEILVNAIAPTAAAFLTPAPQPGRMPHPD